MVTPQAPQLAETPKELLMVVKAALIIPLSRAAINTPILKSAIAQLELADEFFICTTPVISRYFQYLVIKRKEYMTRIIFFCFTNYKGFDLENRKNTFLIRFTKKEGISIHIGTTHVYISQYFPHQKNGLCH